jgi:hypothetical protein
MDSEFGRRLLLKAIGSGAALGILPKSWTRPVVQSVIVPAHAAASPAATTTTRTTTRTTTSTATSATTGAS